MDNIVLSKKSPVSNRRAVLTVLNYFVGYLFLYPWLGQLLCKFFFHLDGITVEVAMVISIFMIVSTVILMWPVIEESVPVFCKHLYSSLGRIVFYLIGLFFTTMFLSVLVMIITGLETSNNQQGIEQMFQNYPAYIVFSVVVFAPIVEELVFRGCFFRSFSHKNLGLAIGLSSLMFGFIHISDMLLTGNLLDGMYLLVYAGMGLWFGWLYKNSQSILPCMLLHMVYNSISVMMLMQ